MKFNLTKSIEILERTPGALSFLCAGLSDDWTHADEGNDTWSVCTVVGHLLYTEQVAWMDRVALILSTDGHKIFPPLDHFAQPQSSAGRPFKELLTAFRQHRLRNLERLRSLRIATADLAATGTHPALGTVRLQEVIASWTVHDLNHLGQIARIMAKQYAEAVGPFRAYLPILT